MTDGQQAKDELVDRSTNQIFISHVIFNTIDPTFVYETYGAGHQDIGPTIQTGVVGTSGDRNSTNLEIHGVNSRSNLWVYNATMGNPLIIWSYPGPNPNGPGAVNHVALGTNRTPVWTGPFGVNPTLTINADHSVTVS